MSLKNKKIDNELLNRFYKYEKFKEDYLVNIPARHQAELDNAKLDLIGGIQRLKDCGCFDTEATEEEKAEIDNLLTQLNS